MTTGELIGNARNFALRTLGKTKTLRSFPRHPKGA